jgi:hypothetical protein
MEVIGRKQAVGLAPTEIRSLQYSFVLKCYVRSLTAKSRFCRALSIKVIVSY